MKNGSKIILFTALGFLSAATAQRFVKVFNTFSDLSVANPNDIYTNVWVVDFGSTNAGMFTWIPGVTNATSAFDVVQSSYVSTGRWFRVTALNTNLQSDIHVTNIFTTNLYAGDTFVSNVFTTNLIAGDVYTTNIITTNITAVNTTFYNLFAGDSFVTNLYVSNVTAGAISVTNLNADTLVGTDSSTNLQSVTPNANQLIKSGDTLSIISDPSLTNTALRGLSLIGAVDTADSLRIGSTTKYASYGYFNWPSASAGPIILYTVPSSPSTTFGTAVGSLSTPIWRWNGNSTTISSTADLAIMTDGVTISGHRNVRLGKDSSSTNFTTGYVYMQAINGVPIGTPTSYTFHTPFIYDQTGSSFYIYDPTGARWQRQLNFLDDTADKFDMWRGLMLSNSFALYTQGQYIYNPSNNITFLTTIALGDWSPTNDTPIFGESSLLWPYVGDDSFAIFKSSVDDTSFGITFYNGALLTNSVSSPKPLIDGQAYNLGFSFDASTKLISFIIDEEAVDTTSFSLVAETDFYNGSSTTPGTKLTPHSESGFWLRNYAVIRESMSPAAMRDYFVRGPAFTNRYDNVAFDIDFDFVNPDRNPIMYNRAGTNNMVVYPSSMGGGLQIKPIEYLFAKRLDTTELNADSLNVSATNIVIEGLEPDSVVVTDSSTNITSLTVLDIARGGLGANVVGGAVGGIPYRANASFFLTSAALDGVVLGNGTGAPTSVAGNTNQLFGMNADASAYEFKELVGGTNVVIEHSGTNITINSSASSTPPTATASQVSCSGTNNQSTITYAPIVFGTQDPTITLPSAGTYRVFALVQKSVTNSALTTVMHFKLYNDTDAADVSDSERLIEASNNTGPSQITLENIVTVAATKDIQVWVEADDVSGQEPWLQPEGTSISYIKLSD